MAEDEPDALYTLRQSLIDLAAIAENLAEELPRPARMRTTLPEWETRFPTMGSGRDERRAMAADRSAPIRVVPSR